MSDKLYKIGELAEMSGVPVKTIRYYADIGALPPTTVLDSSYRLFSDDDRARLELIRSLRDLDIDLRTIIELLGEKVPVKQALALQLEVVEAGLRTLKRRRALLKATLRKGETKALAYLDRTRALARLNAMERASFLSEQMERVFEGVPADEGWKARFWQGAVLDLPEEMTEAQLDAWLELVEIVADEDFIRRMNEIGREHWQQAATRPDAAQTSAEIQGLYLRAIEALQAGHTPQSDVARPLVNEYLEIHARLLRRPADAELAGELLQMVEQRSDARAERYWELIAILKNQTEGPPIGKAHHWLMDGLRFVAALAAVDAQAGQ